MKRPLVFSPTKWAAFRKRADPVTREIMDLWGKTGLCEFKDRVLEIEAAIWEPEKQKRGPKPIWSDGNVLYAWLALEIHWLIVRRTNPKAELKPTIDELFRKRRGKPLRVLHNAAGGRHLEIDGPPTARRLHATGKKFLKENPELALRWRALAEHGARMKLPNARKLVR